MTGNTPLNRPNRPNPSANPPIAKLPATPSVQAKAVTIAAPLGVGFHPYSLDRHAYNLVLKYCQKSEAVKESHKMRVAVAYGLERFWGEHLREGMVRDKANYWKDVWIELGKIMIEAGIDLPDRDGNVQSKEERGIKETTDRLCQMSLADTRATLSVLTQLCDALVWWTQRLK